MTDIHVCTFSGLGSLPLLAAAHQGFFNAHGIRVDLERAMSSGQLMSGLVDGVYEIVHAAPDNIIAWSDRTGRDLRAWIGGSAGPLALVARPEVRDISQLRGRKIAVDAANCGFAGVLREILLAEGLGTGEYHVVEVGATGLRYQALSLGEVDATLLSIPTSFRAEASGLSILATHDAFLGHYQSFAGSSRGEWLDLEPDIADACLRAIVSTLTWLYDPANRDAVTRLTVDEFDLTEDEGRRAVEAIIEPSLGWPPTGLISLEAMGTVCRIRDGTPNPAARSPGEYVDLGPSARVHGWSVDDG